MIEPVKIFISYAQKDEPWLKELENHLTLLTRQKLIVIWGKHKSLPGTETISEARARLQSAAIILLLISPDYLASDDCYSQELEQAIQRHKSGDARVIPILLRSVDWKSAPFASLQALPRNDLFIVPQPDTDALFSQVAQGIRETVEAWIESHPEKVPVPASRPPEKAVQPWNIPFQPTPFFTGREQILSQISAHLSNGQIAAISGLGGVGKTQTAVQYAHRHKNEYAAILWVRANTLEELAEEFANLAKVLDLSSKDEQDQQQIINTVKYWLKNTPNWLLIFDNADELTLLPPYLPQEPQGHILLTTRAYAMAGLAENVEIPIMAQQDGAFLLLRRAGLLKKGASLEQAKEADLQLAYKIVHELGGLPLALDQAGAYVEETGTDLASYLEIFRDESAELLMRRGGISFDHAPVATTWKVALEIIEQTHPEAIELMRLYSFLAPDAIPEELLAKVTQYLSPALQKLAQKSSFFNEAIALLRKYSLIQRDPTTKTLTLHRLIQIVIKDGIKQTQHREWSFLIIRIIEHVFPFDEAGPWPQSQCYLPHALLAAEYIKHWSFTFSEARNLSNALGVYFMSRGQYSEAEPFFLYLHAFFERIAGTEYLEAVGYLNNLAILYNEQGKYERAESLYEQALRIREASLGPEHPDVASSLNNLSLLYQDQGKYKEAESLIERGLKIREARLGLEHPDVASSLSSLAGLYREQGRYEEAELLLKRALKIREERLGPEHPQVAGSLNNLGGLYHREQGRYEEAELLLKRALKIREERLGPEHPQVASGLNNLADLYREQGRYEEAELLLKRALRVQEARLGLEHPQVATSLSSLAGLYQEQGRYEEAELLLKRALRIQEERLGPEHPGVASSLNNLAGFYQEQGRYEGAESLFKRALKIREERLGLEHPDVAGSLNNLAGLYQEQGKYEEVEPLLKRALKIQEERLGLDHSDIAISLNTLGLLYYNQMNYAEAKLLYQRALSIFEQRLGTEHPNIATNLVNLANLYRDQGNYVQAEPLYQRALSIFEQRLGTEHPDTATCLYDLALLYDKQNDYKQAEPLYQQALSIREQRLGKDHPHTIEARNHLRELQQKQEIRGA